MPIEAVTVSWPKEDIIRPTHVEVSEYSYIEHANVTDAVAASINGTLRARFYKVCFFDPW